jgi:hypothetical protein
MRIEVNQYPGSAVKKRLRHRSAHRWPPTAYKRGKELVPLGPAISDLRFADSFLALNYARKFNYLFARLGGRQVPQLWLARSGHHVQ